MSARQLVASALDSQFFPLSKLSNRSLPKLRAERSSSKSQQNSIKHSDGPRWLSRIKNDQKCLAELQHSAGFSQIRFVCGGTKQSSRGSEKFNNARAVARPSEKYKMHRLETFGPLKLHDSYKKKYIQEKLPQPTGQYFRPLVNPEQNKCLKVYNKPGHLAGPQLNRSRHHSKPLGQSKYFSQENAFFTVNQVHKANQIHQSRPIGNPVSAFPLNKLHPRSIQHSRIINLGPQDTRQPIPERLDSRFLPKLVQANAARHSPQRKMNTSRRPHQVSPNTNLSSPRPMRRAYLPVYMPMPPVARGPTFSRFQASRSHIGHRPAPAQQMRAHDLRLALRQELFRERLARSCPLRRLSDRCRLYEHGRTLDVPKFGLRRWPAVMVAGPALRGVSPCVYFS